MISLTKYQVLQIIFFCFFALISINTSQAQSKKDSLFQQAGKENHDTTKIKILFEVGNLYIDGPSDSLIYYYKQALALIDSAYANTGKKNTRLINTYKNLKFRAILEIGIEYFFQGNYNQSLENYQKALEIANEINDMGLISEVYGALGIVYKNQGEYALASGIL